MFIPRGVQEAMSSGVFDCEHTTNPTLFLTQHDRDGNFSGYKCRECGIVWDTTKDIDRVEEHIISLRKEQE